MSVEDFERRFQFNNVVRTYNNLIGNKTKISNNMENKENSKGSYLPIIKEIKIKKSSMNDYEYNDSAYNQESSENRNKMIKSVKNNYNSSENNELDLYNSNNDFNERNWKSKYYGTNSTLSQSMVFNKSNINSNMSLDNVEEKKKLLLRNLSHESIFAAYKARYLLATKDFKNKTKLAEIDYKRQLGEAPVYKEIKNIANIKLNIFKREITEKIKDIKMKILEYNVPKVFEESNEPIIKCLTDLKSKIEIDLKSQKKNEILTKLLYTFQNEMNKQKEKLVKTLEDFSDNLKNNYNQTFRIINKFKNDFKDKYEFEELKTYISSHLGERNDYKEAITNIVTDILSTVSNVTNLENSTGFFDYLKTLISDEGFLNKASEFIIQKTEKR